MYWSMHELARPIRYSEEQMADLSGGSGEMHMYYVSFINLTMKIITVTMR